jgi:hypothetical protein
MISGHHDRDRSSVALHWCTRWLGSGFLMLLFLPLGLQAQASKPTEFEVKAAYLFNFGKFVKWPGSIELKDDSFAICVLGGDPFGGVLDSTVSGERIDGRTVTVRRIAAASEASKCRIVFVSASEQGRIASIMTALAHLPVLTVSDIDGFARHQGMIGFLMDHDRVRFEVNLSAAEKVGLTLSSELLKVATSVKREGQPGE